MLSPPNTTALVAAGIAGTLFLGYCIYFDRKRRSDPLYKQKIRERRLKARSKAQKRGIVTPDLKNTEAVQKFFLQEVQLGEELLAQGEIESAVEHLSAAVAVCGQPAELMQMLQHSLPVPVFNMLLQRLPLVTQQIMVNMEEDVE